MGRAGVTQQDVEEAALQLQGRGKNPTVDAIREVLGTGSKSTIIQHLKAWKSQCETGQGKLPPELLALISGLWERLNTQADSRISEIEALNAQCVEQYQNEIQQLQQDSSVLKNQYHETEAHLKTEHETRVSLEQQLASLQQTHAALVIQAQAATQQLEDQKVENQRLHGLAANMQANLEHYQAAAQQARIEQNLLMEKQQADFQHKMTIVQQQIAQQSEETKIVELKWMTTNESLQQLTRQHQELQQVRDQLMGQMQAVSQEAVIYKERFEQTQQQWNTAKIELSEKNKSYSQLEKNIAILSEKYESLQIQYQRYEDKVELLQNEKLILIQEKSQLEIRYLQQKEVALKNAIAAADITI